MEDLTLVFKDDDHVWINGRQFVSLKRASEMKEEAVIRTRKTTLNFTQKEHQTANKGRWQHIVDPNWCGGGYTKCTACGNGFSDKYYHEVDEWRHCPNCGAEMVVDDE